MAKQGRRVFSPSTLGTLIAFALSQSVSANFDDTFMEQGMVQGFASDQPSKLNVITRDGSKIAVPYVLVDGHAVVEGDMILRTPEGNDPIIDGQGVAYINSGALWLNGIVAYKLDAGIGADLKGKIASAMEHWKSRTGIRFVERTSEPDFVLIQPGTGCASQVGFVGGRQLIKLSNLCQTGNIIHEIGHTLGFFHEHTRPDRDDYIQVNIDNVTSGFDHNFQRVTHPYVRGLGTYDFGSIMHYGQYAFSSNGKATITPKNGTGGATIGQRNGLSANDIRSLQEVYSTDLVISQSGSSSINAGVRSDYTITVENQYDFGANDLELEFDFGNGLIFAGATGNGWQCSKEDMPICRRSHLSPNEVSTITLSLIGVSQSNAHVAASLLAATQDYDMENNTVSIAPQVGGVAASAGGNSAPIVIIHGAISAASASGAGDVVGEITSFDSENDSVSYSISGGTGAHIFTVDPKTGAIKVKDAAALRGASGSTVTLDITASDGSNVSSANTAQIKISADAGGSAGASSNAPSTSAATSGSSGGGGGGALTLIGLWALIAAAGGSLFMRYRRK